MAREILTAYDVVTACSDFLNMGASATDLRRIKRAMNSALSEVQQAVPSEYMLKQDRLHFSAPVTDGTVTYTHSTRLLVLSGATWPSNAVDYCVVLGTLICDIESRISDAVVRLDVALNPGEDLAAGTTYTLLQRYYRLPDDFGGTDNFWSETIPTLGTQVPMSQIVGMNRYYGSQGTPSCWAIGGIQDQVGARGLFIYPFSDAAMTQDYVYPRRPREIRYTGYAANDYVGSIATSTSNTVVTGSTTAFASPMAGAVLRAYDGATVPTGLTGETPWTDERLIHTVASATGLTVDRAFSFSGSSKKYRITDPIDIDPMLYDLFLTRCYLELASQGDHPSMSSIVASYNQKLHTARCAANMNRQSASPIQPRVTPGFSLNITTSEAE